MIATASIRRDSAVCEAAVACKATSTPQSDESPDRWCIVRPGRTAGGRVSSSRLITSAGRALPRHASVSSRYSSSCSRADDVPDFAIGVRARSRGRVHYPAGAHVQAPALTPIRVTIVRRPSDAHRRRRLIRLLCELLDAPDRATGGAS